MPLNVTKSTRSYKSPYDCVTSYKNPADGSAELRIGGMAETEDVNLELLVLIAILAKAA